MAYVEFFLSVFVTEFKFCMYTPSMIAAASVAAALNGLDWTRKSGRGLTGLLDELTRITSIEQVSVVRTTISEYIAYRLRVCVRSHMRVRRVTYELYYLDYTRSCIFSYVRKQVLLLQIRYIYNIYISARRAL